MKQKQLVYLKLKRNIFIVISSTYLRSHLTKIHFYDFICSLSKSISACDNYLKGEKEATVGAFCFKEIPIHPPCGLDSTSKFYDVSSKSK